MARIYGRMLSREGVRSARRRNSAGGDQGQGGFHHFLRIDHIGKDLEGAEKAGGEDEDRLDQLVGGEVERIWPASWPLLMVSIRIFEARAWCRWSRERTTVSWGPQLNGGVIARQPRHTGSSRHISTTPCSQARRPSRGDSGPVRATVMASCAPSRPAQPPVVGTASVTGSRSIIVNPSMVSQICSTSAMQPMTRLGMLTLSLL